MFSHHPVWIEQCFESFCSSKFCALVKIQISQLQFSLFHEHLYCELLLFLFFTSGTIFTIKFFTFSWALDLWVLIVLAFYLGNNFYNLRFHFFMDSGSVSFDLFSFLLQEQFSQFKVSQIHGLLKCEFWWLTIFANGFFAAECKEIGNESFFHF